MKFILATVRSFYNPVEAKRLAKYGFEFEEHESPWASMREAGLKEYEMTNGFGVLEIETLDDLMNFVKEIGEEIIIHNGVTPAITIYDDYIE